MYQPRAGVDPLINKKWFLLEQNYHININEMVAVQFGLKYFAGEYNCFEYSSNNQCNCCVNFKKHGRLP